MSVKLGIAPIAWSNDDMPELGGDTSLEQCLSEASQAGYTGIESGGKFPKKSNFVSLSDNETDKLGIPILKINVDYDENDELMIQDFFDQLTEMYRKAGFKNIKTTDTGQAPGLDIHEMGGVRMGNDPETSLLDKWNRLHNCKNVFVTDGSCMTSTGTQNPSLTFMAITARAANYAVELLKKGEL